MAYIGHSPSTGEDNNFKILDNISSYTLTFDGSSSSVVSAANDTIYSYDHRFVQGQRVTYNNGGGGNINGLTSGSVYFVIKQDHNNIKLATTAARAASGTAEDLSLSGTSGSSHTLNVAFDGVNTKFKATHTTGKKARITRGAQLVLSVNGVIQQPHDSSTPSTGFGFDLDGTIVFSQAPQSTDVFWGHILTNNNVTFDISDNKVDHFSGDGSTSSFTLSKSPPNNENILVTIDGVVQYPNDGAGNIRAYSVAANVINFTTAPGSGTQIEVRHIGFAGATTGSGGGGVTGVYGRTGNVVLIDSDNITVNDAAITGNATVSGNTTITGDLTVNGTTTTLDTKLTEVDQLLVAANNSTVAVAVTQSGAGDILQLFDGTSKVIAIDDTGKIGIGTAVPQSLIHTQASTSNGLMMQTPLGDHYIWGIQAAGNLMNGSTAGDLGIRGKSGISISGNNGTATQVRIDSSGRLLVGHTSTIDTSTYNSKIQVMGTDAAASITVGRFGDNASASAINLTKSRNGTVGNHGSGELHNNDVIGNIFWWGSDGSDYEEVARIGVNAGAAYTSGGTPGELTFWTTASGATTATERLSINSSGELISTNGTLRRNVNDSSFTVSGGTASNSGANVNLYGASHSSLANSLRVRVGASVKLLISSEGDVTIKNHSAGGGLILDSRDSTDNYSLVTGNANRASADYVLTGIRGDWNSDSVAAIYLKTGPDTTNKDDGEITFHTQTSGTNTLSERLRIKSDGKVLVGSGCTDASTFNVKGSAGFADDGTNAGLIISTDDANGAALSCLTTGGFTNGSYGIMRLNAVQHKFTYGNTVRLHINSTGNIGQAVTPSAWSSAQANDFFAYQVGSGMAIFGRGSGDKDRGGISCNYYSTASAHKYIGDGHAGRIYFEDGSIVFNNTGPTANDQGADAALTLLERLRITKEGYLFFKDNGGTYTNATQSYSSEGAFLTHYTARTTTGGDKYRRMFDIASVGANPWGSSIRFLTSADSTNPATTIERVRIDHNGRVGINKTTPATMLSIKAERSAVPRFGIDGHYSDSSYTQSTWDDSSGLYTLLGVNHKLDASGNDASPVEALHSASIFLNGRSGDIRFYTKVDTGTTFNEVLRMDDSKSIIIGNTTTSGNKVYFQSTSGSAQWIQADGTDNQDLQFGRGSSEYMRIDSGGRIRIGRSNKAVAKGALIIDNEDRDAMSDRSDPDNFGIVLCGSSTSNHGNGIAFCNDNAQNTAAAIIAVDRGSNNLGDLRFYTKHEGSPSTGPLEGLRINCQGSLVGATSGVRERDDLKLFETMSMPKWIEGYSNSNTDLNVAASMFHQTHVRGTGHLTTELFSTKMGGNGGMYVQVEVWFSCAVANYQGYQMLWANANRTSWGDFTINNTGQEGNKLGSDTGGYFDLTYASSGSGADQRLTWKVTTSFGNNYVRCLYKTTCLGHDYFKEFNIIR